MKNPFKNPFKVVPKAFLGVDIGVSSIKLVELSRWGGRVELKNYGHISVSPLYQRPVKTFTEETFLLSTVEVSEVIKAILKETRIKTKESVLTIPDFSTFFTTFELPPMSEDEIPDAVNFEANQHIPVPVSDVVLDWHLIEGKTGKKGTRLKILLVAVPKDLVDRYQKIAKGCGVNLKFLEAEAFSLARALIRNRKEPFCLLDIGAQSTTINIADNGILKLSHSFDISGNDFSHSLMKSLDIDPKKADFMKREQGLENRETRDILFPLINLIIIEIEKILKDFSKSEGKEIQKIIICGGSALLPGLDKYLHSHFKKEVKIANPFSDIFYPPLLEKKLEKIGPAFTVAVGAALKGLR